MPGNFRKEDMRIIKTQKALLDALRNLLERYNFGRLTVNVICEEALLSRAAFYTHFQDKYDLLKHLLESLKPCFMFDDTSDAIKKANGYINGNTKLIINLLDDANKETLELLHEFVISLLNIPVQKNANGELRQYITLSNFCSGGIINLISWQIKNKFPPDLPMITSYFISMLKALLK